MEAVLLQQVFVSLCSVKVPYSRATLAATPIAAHQTRYALPRVHFFVPMEVALAVLLSAVVPRLVVLRTETVPAVQCLVQTVCVSQIKTSALLRLLQRPPVLTYHQQGKVPMRILAVVPTKSCAPMVNVFRQIACTLAKLFPLVLPNFTDGGMEVARTPLVATLQRHV